MTSRLHVDLADDDLHDDTARAVEDREWEDQIARYSDDLDVLAAAAFTPAPGPPDPADREAYPTRECSDRRSTPSAPSGRLGTPSPHVERPDDATRARYREARQERAAAAALRPEATGNVTALGGRCPVDHTRGEAA